MILGVGTDIVEISRIARAAKSKAFLRKCFTESELAYAATKADAAQHLAGCFAAKESVAKALGNGFLGFWPRDIEIRRSDAGKPYVQFSDAVPTPPAIRLEISISHCHAYATAFAICWQNKEDAHELT